MAPSSTMARMGAACLILSFLIVSSLLISVLVSNHTTRAKNAKTHKQLKAIVNANEDIKAALIAEHDLTDDDDLTDLFSSSEVESHSSSSSSSSSDSTTTTSSLSSSDLSTSSSSSSTSSSSFIEVLEDDDDPEVLAQKKRGIPSPAKVVSKRHAPPQRAKRGAPQTKRH